MDAMIDKTLMSQIRTLSPQQVAEVQDFVEFLVAKARKRTAMDRLLGCRDRDVDPQGVVLSRKHQRNRLAGDCNPGLTILQSPEK